MCTYACVSLCECVCAHSRASLHRWWCTDDFSHPGLFYLTMHLEMAPWWHRDVPLSGHSPGPAVGAAPGVLSCVLLGPGGTSHLLPSQTEQQRVAMRPFPRFLRVSSGHPPMTRVRALRLLPRIPLSPGLAPGYLHLRRKQELRGHRLGGSYEVAVPSCFPHCNLGSSFLRSLTPRAPDSSTVFHCCCHRHPWFLPLDNGSPAACWAPGQSQSKRMASRCCLTDG